MSFRQACVLYTPAERPWAEREILHRGSQATGVAFPRQAVEAASGGDVRLGQRSRVVPRQPAGGGSRQFSPVSVQLGKIIERVGAAQLSRVDQAHEQVANTRSVFRPVEQRVFAMQDRFLQRSFADVMPPA